MQSPRTRPWKCVPTASCLFWGVCAGAAYTLAVPPSLVRLIGIAALFLSSGLMVFIYFGLWLTLPKWDILPDDFQEVTQMK